MLLGTLIVASKKRLYDEEFPRLIMSKKPFSRGLSTDIEGLATEDHLVPLHTLEFLLKYSFRESCLVFQTHLIYLFRKVV